MPESTVEPRDAPPAWSPTDLRSDPHAREDKAQRVRRMFASIARSYDVNNRLHSFGRDQAWRRAAVRMAGLRDGDEVLDVACGTGDLTRAFADGGAARCVGLDFTPEMLDIARTKRLRARNAESADTITYIEGDAKALPFDDGSFDVVSIAFGIRNVDDPERALAEFRRVLRPGGRLVVLEFRRPGLAPIAWANTVYTKVVMPVSATIISRDRSGAYRYLPRSIETFLTPGEMIDALLDAGFTSVRTKSMTFGVCACYVALPAG